MKYVIKNVGGDIKYGNVFGDVVLIVAVYDEQYDYLGKGYILLGKRCAETLCMDYYRQHGVLVKIIRIFNTYGPNMLTDDGRVISNFVVQALLDKDITIYGDGKQTRSFQYIDDLVEGMIRMMATEDHFTGPVNIGNPCEFSIFELAQKILELTCSHSNIIFEPLPHDDPRQRRPDITLAREKLDWEPHIHQEAP